MTEVYTKGPWSFDGVCQIVELARPHMRVCFLPSDHAEYASSVPNGYLIAASPDLLTALKDLVRINEQHNEAISRIIGRPLGWKDDYLTAARAAIARAEGSAP